MVWWGMYAMASADADTDMYLICQLEQKKSSKHLSCHTSLPSSILSPNHPQSFNPPSQSNPYETKTSSPNPPLLQPSTSKPSFPPIYFPKDTSDIKCISPPSIHPPSIHTYIHKQTIPHTHIYFPTYPLRYTHTYLPKNYHKSPLPYRYLP